MSTTASQTFDLGGRCETLGCTSTVTDSESDDSYINIDTAKRCSECVDATPRPSHGTEVGE